MFTHDAAAAALSSTVQTMKIFHFSRCAAPLRAVWTRGEGLQVSCAAFTYDRVLGSVGGMGGLLSVIANAITRIHTKCVVALRARAEDSHTIPQLPVPVDSCNFQHPQMSETLEILETKTLGNYPTTPTCENKIQQLCNFWNKPNHNREMTKNIVRSAHLAAVTCPPGNENCGSKVAAPL